MNKLLVGVTATVALGAFTGCKNKDATSGSSTGSDTKAGDTKVVDTKAADTKVAGGSCPAGTTKNDAGGFCAKLPDGYQAKPEHKIGTTQVDYEYRDANNNNGVTFTVKTFAESDFEMSAKLTKDNSDAAKGTSTEIPGGTYWLYDDKEDIWGRSLTHGAAKTIECTTRMGSKSSDPDKDTVLGICKTVTAL
jgi:hypothetical protein